MKAETLKSDILPYSPGVAPTRDRAFKGEL